MGRPRLPDSVKAAQGTLQKCRANRSMMEVDKQLPVAPPVGLTKDAQAAWSMAVTCAPAGLLSVLDHTILERWARNYAMYRKLQKAVDHDGAIEISKNGSTSLSANFTALMKVQAALAACEKDLGFSPVSRARVRIEEKTDNEENAFIEA